MTVSECTGSSPGSPNYKVPEERHIVILHQDSCQRFGGLCAMFAYLRHAPSSHRPQRYDTHKAFQPM